ncbi:hypothetical protein GQ457_15G020990 [Hibiscus cannabinus]
MERAQRRCFVNGIDVSVVGSQGDLCLAWSQDMTVSRGVQNRPNRYLLARFYGRPIDSEREASWDLIRQLGSDLSLPWLIMGDFNELLSSSEKCDGKLHPKRNMEDFRNALLDTNLSDIGFTGHWYTWEKKKALVKQYS